MSLTDWLILPSFITLKIYIIEFQLLASICHQANTNWFFLFIIVSYQFTCTWNPKRLSKWEIYLVWLFKLKQF